MLVVMLLLPSKLGLLHEARLTDLVRTDPFALDGPAPVAPMLWVVSCKVAVFNQSTASVVA